MKKLLRLDEAGEILGCSRSTLYRLIAEGELTALKIRGSLRITDTSLEEYMRREILKFERDYGIDRKKNVSECISACPDFF